MLALFFIALVLSAGNIAHFIIIVLSFDLMYIVYRKGLVRKLLDRLTIDSYSSVPDLSLEEIKQLEEVPLYLQQPEEEKETREELEQRAGIIIGRQGQNPATTKYMGDVLLIRIIRDYNDCLDGLDRTQLEELSLSVLKSKGYKKAEQLVRMYPDYMLVELLTV